MITMEPTMTEKVRLLVKKFLKEAYLVPYNAGAVKVFLKECDTKGTYKALVYHRDIFDFYDRDRTVLNEFLRKTLPDDLKDVIVGCELYGKEAEDKFYADTNSRPKVFISIPMRGYDINEVHKKILSIYKKKFKKKYDLLDQVYDTTHGEVANLAHSLSLMAEADLVYFVNGWEVSHGCVIEKIICDTYNLYYDFERESSDLYEFRMSGYTAKDMIRSLATLDPDSELDLEINNYNCDDNDDGFGICVNNDCRYFTIGPSIDKYIETIQANDTIDMYNGVDAPLLDDSKLKKTSFKAAKKKACIAEVEVDLIDRLNRFFGVYYPCYVSREEIIKNWNSNWNSKEMISERIFYVAFMYGTRTPLFISTLPFENKPYVYELGGTFISMSHDAMGTDDDDDTELRDFVNGINRVYLNHKSDMLILDHDYCKDTVKALFG